MKKLTIAAFVALMGLFVVGCGDPGEMDDGMEGMEQEQQDGMGQDDGFGQEDGMGQDDGFGDDAYGDEEGEQDW